MGRSHGSRENGEKSTTRSVRKGYAEIDSTNLGTTLDEWKRPETTFLNHSLRCCSYNTIQKTIHSITLFSRTPTRSAHFFSSGVNRSRHASSSSASNSNVPSSSTFARIIIFVSSLTPSSPCSRFRSLKKSSTSPFSPNHPSLSANTCLLWHPGQVTITTPKLYARLLNPFDDRTPHFPHVNTA